MTTPTEPQAHDAPLLWLVREKLHKGTTLAERVRRLRYKRRRPKVISEQQPTSSESCGPCMLGDADAMQGAAPPPPYEAQPSEPVPVGEPAQEGVV